MITSRDRQVISFIEMSKICTAQQIKSVFFRDVDISKVYRRLNVLLSKEYIKLCKIGINNYYYVGRRTSKKMLEHDLKTTDLLGFLLINNCSIINFERNKKIGSTINSQIITDGYVAYKVRVGEKLYKRHFIIEVQRFVQYIPHKTHGALYTCIEKYNHNSVLSGLKKICEENNFKTLPPLLVITDIKDNTSLSYNTSLIKLPFNIDNNWNILVK